MLTLLLLHQLLVSSTSPKMNEGPSWLPVKLALFRTFRTEHIFSSTSCTQGQNLSTCDKYFYPPMSEDLFELQILHDFLPVLKIPQMRLSRKGSILEYTWPNRALEEKDIKTILLKATS